ncbi:Hcn4, partial [Symbiodinium pilosum]
YLVTVKSGPVRIKSEDRDLQSRGRGVLANDQEASSKTSAKIARICDQPMVVESNKSDTGLSEKPKESTKESFTENFAPRSCWNIDNASSPAHSIRRRSAMSQTVGSFTKPGEGSVQDLNLRAFGLESRSRWADFVIHPHATPRIVWDLFGMFFLMRDIVFIPLQLFDVPEYQTMKTLATMSLLFWTIDILLSFFTGYYEKGRLELGHRKIAWNYMTTWFLLDIGVVGVDWWLETTETADGSEGVARVTKSIRSARFFRMFRLIRLSKMSKVSAFLREQISSEAGAIQFGILRVIAKVFLLQHLIACGWWGVGNSIFGDFDGSTISWISAFGMDREGVSFEYQYTTCLHWAFAQLGMGSVEGIEAVNTEERAFCILVAFTCLISFSTLVSTVTSLMSNLQKAQDEEQQLFRDLRRFLHQNDIPIDLSQRVTRFLQHAYRARSSRTADSEVAIFGLLSKPLYAELQFTRYQSCLYSLILLRKILLTEDARYQAETVAQKLAVKALTTVQLAQNDIVFNRGTVADTTYFSLDESLRYFHYVQDEDVGRGTLIAEVGLWTPWVHIGDLVATDMNGLVAIDIEAFCQCVGETQETKQQAIFMAQSIVSALNDIEILTDLWLYPIEDEAGFESASTQGAKKIEGVRLDSITRLVKQRWQRASGGPHAE